MADDPQTPDTDDTAEVLLEIAHEGSEQQQEDGAEEEIPTFGDTPDEERDTDNATIRHLRSTLRQAQKDLAEARKSAPQGTVELGPKPKIADFDYDEDRYEAALDKWKDQERASKQQQSAATQTAEDQQRFLVGRLEKVQRETQALGRGDAEEAVDTVRAALGEAKFAGIAGLLDDGTDAGKFFYALAKSPQQLEAIASQNDGIRLLKEITRLEGQLKMVKRRAPAAIDTPERGSGNTIPAKRDKELERLEKEAERDGDRTRIVAYKKLHGIK